MKQPRKQRADAGKPRATTIDDICDRFTALSPDARMGLLLTLQQLDRALRKLMKVEPDRRDVPLGSLMDPAQNAALLTEEELGNL